MKRIWWSEECTARAVYLSRILQLAKEWYCWRSRAIWLCLSTGLQKKKRRCFLESCGYIFNWAWVDDYWNLAECFLIFSDTSLLSVAFVPLPYYPAEQGGTVGDLQKYLSSSSPSFVCFREQSCKVPMETPHSSQVETILTWCCTLLMPSCGHGAMTSGLGGDRALL